MVSLKRVVVFCNYPRIFLKSGNTNGGGLLNCFVYPRVDCFGANLSHSWYF